MLIGAGVVFGGARAYRNVFSGPYPHLAINIMFLPINLLAGATLTVAVLVFVRRRTSGLSSAA